MLLVHISSIRNDPNSTFWAQKSKINESMKFFKIYAFYDFSKINFLDFLSAIFGAQNVLIPLFLTLLTSSMEWKSAIKLKLFCEWDPHYTNYQICNKMKLLQKGITGT